MILGNWKLGTGTDTGSTTGKTKTKLWTYFQQMCKQLFKNMKSDDMLSSPPIILRVQFYPQTVLPIFLCMHTFTAVTKRSWHSTTAVKFHRQYMVYSFQMRQKHNLLNMAFFKHWLTSKHTQAVTHTQTHHVTGRIPSLASIHSSTHTYIPVEFNQVNPVGEM